MVRRFTLLSSTMLAVVITLGGAAAWGILAAWSLMVQEQVGRSTQVYEYLMVAADGTPFIQRYHGTSWAEREYRDLDGAAIPIEADRLVLQGALLGTPPRRDFFRDFGITTGRLAAFSDGRQQPTYWYTIQEAGHDSIVFQGFDSKSKLRVGYIGAGGFSQERPIESERIPCDSRNMSAIAAPHLTMDQPEYSPGFSGPGRLAPWKVYLLSGRRLLEVDLREQSVREVFTADGMFAMSIIERAAPAKADKGGSPSSAAVQRLAIRTADSVLIVSPNDGQHVAYPIPINLRGDLLTVYELVDERLLALSYRKSGHGDTTYRLAWLDAAGESSKRREVRVQTGSLNRLPDQALIAAMIPSPLALALAATVIGPVSLVNSGFEPNYGTALVHQLGQWWPYLIPLVMLSAALAVLAFRRQRQLALPTPIFWAAFVLLAGPIGFVAYLAHRNWPPRKACPHCGQPVPQDRERCAECSAPFPSPARKGIEIFA